MATSDPWAGLADFSAGAPPRSADQTASLPSMATWQLLRRKDDGAMFMHDPQTGNMIAYPGGADAPVTPKEQPSTVTDVAKSAGSGLERGVTGLAGAIPTASEAMRKLADKYLFDPVLGKMPEGAPKPPNVADYAGIQALDKMVPGANYQPQTTAGKYAQTAGEFVPGALLAPGGLATRAANAVRAGVIPGVTSEAAGQAAQGTPYEGPARVAGAVAGGAVGPALINAPGRLISPNPMPAERAGLVNTMENEGVPLTAGQKTGNARLQYAESTLSAIPGAGGKAAAIERTQGIKYTQAALKRAGIDETSLRQAGVNDVPSPLLATPDVLQAGKKMLGKQFENLSARNTLTMDPRFGQDIRQAASEYGRLVNPSQQAPGVNDIASDLLTRAVTGATIPGDEYQAFRSRLGKTADRLSDQQQAQAYRGFQGALDNAMERSVKPEDAGAWADLRNKYANIKVIEGAANKPGEGTALGYLSPARLRTAVANARDAGYALGKGDLAPLARAGVGTMTPLPQSGTQPRSYFQHLPELIGGAAGYGLHGTPGAMEGALMAAAAPPLAGRTIMSKPVQAYLSNQVAPRVGLISQIDPRALELTRGTNLLQSLFNQPGQVDQQSSR